MNWRDKRDKGGLKDEDVGVFKDKIDDFKSAIGELQVAQSEGVAAANAMKSWAELGLKLVEVAGPIVTQELERKREKERETPVDQPDPKATKIPDFTVTNIEAILSAFLKRM